MGYLLLDSTTAALFGAIIGGAIGFLGTIITGWVTLKKETKIFKRSITHEHLNEVVSSYSYALNILFNLKRGGHADRASNGSLFAQMSLLGSEEVRRMLNEIFELPPGRMDDFNIDVIIEEMKRHISELKTKLI